MDKDLSRMSGKELKNLKQRIDRELQKREREEKKKAKDAVRKTAREYGFSLNELVSGQSTSRSSRKPKYRNPSNPSATWTGVGRKPNWVKEWLDKGGSLKDLEIRE